MSETNQDDRASVDRVVMPSYRDRRFTRAIYVVEDDHAIKYAGESFMAARDVLRGSQNVVVWMDGKWMGYVDANGDWAFKTQHNPAA